MDTLRSVPSYEVMLDSFLDRHGLRSSDLVRNEETAIRSTYLANALVNQGYAGLDDVSLSDPAVGLLLNMLHRDFEHADAAIVSFVSGCGSSAEVIARAAVEASINILYILAGDRPKRLIAYFDRYLDEVDRQSNKWRAQVVESGLPGSGFHEAAVQRRLSANQILREFVSDMGDSGGERWPSTIAERFKLIGDALGYRTFYMRMSSETHGDAEETLRYFIAVTQDDLRVMEAMALETIHTSRFYVYYGVSYLLKASLAYAKSYAMTGVEGPLTKQIAEVDRELIEIGLHIGAGP